MNLVSPLALVSPPTSEEERRARRARHAAVERARLLVETPEHRAKRIEKVRLYSAAQYAANPRKKLASNKLWATANPEKRNAAMRRQRAANPEKAREAYRRWRAENLLKARHASHRWIVAHPEIMRAHERLRRARKRGAPGSHTARQWTALCRTSSWCCEYCNAVLSVKTATRDHKTPLTRGGSDYIENIAISCLMCNLRKHTMTEVEFRARLAA